MRLLRVQRVEDEARIFRVIMNYMVCDVSLFFFSSRRRHTRFDCDWSSDVCSSDLPRLPLSRAWKYLRAIPRFPAGSPIFASPSGGSPPPVQFVALAWPTPVSRPAQ